ncbi:MAG: hypothetical protein JXR97_06140, partial [Planctomycetes bacterium]|nr:hypothetical protein [Planctomycetota bacterium]
MNKVMSKWFLLLLLLLSTTASAEEAVEHKETAFFTGINGNLSAWLVSSPHAEPDANIESRKSTPAETAQQVEGAETWSYVNSGPAPVTLTLDSDPAKPYRYAYCEIESGADEEAVLALNSSAPARLWLDNGEANEARFDHARGVYFTAYRLQMPKGKHRVLLRFNPKLRGPCMFMFLAHRLSATATAPISELKQSLSLLTTRHTNPAPALTIKPSPPFIDKARRMKFTITANLAGVPYQEKAYLSLTSTADKANEWRNKTTIEDIAGFIRDGATFSFSASPKVEWASCPVKAALTLGKLDPVEAECRVISEANTVAKVGAVVEKIESLPPEKSTGPGAAMARLSVEQIKLLGKDRQVRTSYYGENLSSAVIAAEKGFKAAESGVDPYLRRTGMIEGAYISEIDNSVQPYLYYVPKSFGEGMNTNKPMVVLLHGYVPSYNKLSWMTIDDDMQACFDRLGAIILIPFGRNCTDFLTIGEVDVLRAIDEVANRHGVDRKRIYLTGYSMGGS